MSPFRKFACASLVACSLIFLPLTAAAQDDAVIQGVARYRAGEMAEAVQVLQTRLQGPATLQPDDRLRANTYLALALIASGDLTGAQRYAAAALDQEPCLRLAEGTPQEALMLFDRVRPSAGWCSISSTSAMLPSLIVPGLTQALTRKTFPALVMFAGAVTGVGFGITLLGSSGDTYDRYLLSTSTYEAQTLHRVAQQKRIAGAAALGVGLAVWTGSVIDARRLGAQRQRRIRELRTYALEAAPLPAGGVGLGFRFFLGSAQ